SSSSGSLTSRTSPARNGTYRKTTRASVVVLPRPSMPSSVYFSPTDPAARTTPPPGFAATVVGGSPGAAVEPGAGVPMVAGGGSGGAGLAPSSPTRSLARGAPPSPPQVRAACACACTGTGTGTTRIHAARKTGPERKRLAILSRAHAAPPIERGQAGHAGGHLIRHGACTDSSAARSGSNT